MMMRYFLCVFLWAYSAALLAQGTTRRDGDFYKQFVASIQSQDRRIVLIKAPSRDNLGYNLRGYYFLQRGEQRVVVIRGSIDDLGKVYWEEGYWQENNQEEDNATFSKIATFKGSWYRAQGSITGNRQRITDRQATPLVWQEDYKNEALAANIIFNDLKYEDAEIRFHYPYFTNPKGGVRLNQFIADSLMGNMPRRQLRFLEEYRKVRSTGGLTDGFREDNIVYILLNDANVICLKLLASNYTGGSHGIAEERFYSFRISDGQPLQLSDILVAGYDKNLQKLVEQGLRQQYNVPKQQSLADYGFVLPQGRLPLERNFYLTQQGIGFFFNPYQIAPYSAGSQNVFLSFAQLRSLLRKDGALARYIPTR